MFNLQPMSPPPMHHSSGSDSGHKPRKRATRGSRSDENMSPPLPGSSGGSMKPIGKSEDGEMSEGELEKRRMLLLQQLQQEN